MLVLPEYEFYTYELEEFQSRLKEFEKRVLDLAEDLKAAAYGIVFATHGTLGVQFNFANLPKEFYQYLAKLLKKIFSNAKSTKIKEVYPAVEIYRRVTYAEDRDEYDLIEV